MTAATSPRKIHPVILSGGAGVRLWPMSREHYPKQLLPLASDRTMIQDTVGRVGDPKRFAPPLVICNDVHRFIIAEQLRQLGIAPEAIVLEPVGRNTAPAVAGAARARPRQDADALLLVLPADHLIRDTPAFLAAVERAADAAEAGHLVTFGITPTAPETGYGYIRRGGDLAGLPGACRVAEFVEKPKLDVAKQYLAGGRHLWNSGMFLLSAAKYLEELERFEPALLAACRAALEGAAIDLTFLRLDADAFAAAPNISIDYAVMERTAEAAVVPADIGWTDVGAWPALWEVSDKDGDGNVLIGDAVVQDARNCYVRSETMLTAVVGLEDVVVVVTDDAILVAAKDKA